MPGVENRDREVFREISTSDLRHRLHASPLPDEEKGNTDGRRRETTTTTFLGEQVKKRMQRRQR